jgi:predicted phage-related endonuclease
MEKCKEDIMDLMMNRMKDKIKNQKYKLTTQRQVILRAFVESEKNTFKCRRCFRNREEKISRYRSGYGIQDVRFIHGNGFVEKTGF